MIILRNSDVDEFGEGLESSVLVEYAETAVHLVNSSFLGLSGFMVQDNSWAN